MFTCVDNMASMLYDQGKHAEAEPLFREAYKGRRGLFGQRHPETVKSAHSLGAVLKAFGEHAEAAPLLAMSLEACALPSCERSHAVGSKLKHCSGCSSVMYCCPVRAPRPVEEFGLPPKSDVWFWSAARSDHECNTPSLQFHDPKPAGAPAGALEYGGGRS